MLHVAVSSVWSGALTLFLAIVAAASFATAINELTDRASDAAAGKRNRAVDEPRSVAALLAVAMAAGVTFAWLWRNDTRLVACYVATFLAFALYSMRPVRLKSRGLAGVLADAAGEQMFPALAAVLAACHYANRAVGITWIASVGVCALAYGLRGIVWHQLADLENDRAADTWTFARRDPRRAARLGTLIVFPLELSALAAMLWQIGSPWPPLFVALYVLYAAHASWRWRTSAVIVVPKERFFIVLQEFYSHLFPVALLIAASIRNRRDVAVLVIHLLLFPRRAFHLAARMVSMLRVSASTANTVVNTSEPHQGGFG